MHREAPHSLWEQMVPPAGGTHRQRTTSARWRSALQRTNKSHRLYHCFVVCSLLTPKGSSGNIPTTLAKGKKCFVLFNKYSQQCHTIEWIVFSVKFTQSSAYFLPPPPPSRQTNKADSNRCHPFQSSVILSTECVFVFPFCASLLMVRWYVSFCFLCFFFPYGLQYHGLLYHGLQYQGLAAF